MNIDWGIRCCGGNKLVMFGIFKIFCVRNPDIWTDLSEIWRGVGDIWFPPTLAIIGGKCAPEGRKHVKSRRE